MHLPHLQLQCRLGLQPKPGGVVPAWLPPVPPAWQGIHAPELVAALEARLAELVAQPIELESGESYRRVQVMGGMVHDFAADGQVRCYRWVIGPQGEALEPCATASVVADGGPFESRWALPLAQEVRRHLSAQHPQRALDVRHYTDWLMQHMLDHHWHDAQAERVRAKVRRALALHSLALTHCRTIIAAGRPRTARIADYNRALLRLHEDARLLAEAPQLLGLYSLIEQDLPQSGERPAAMRAYLMDNGIRPVTWRLLHQQGTDWMQDFMRYFDDSVGGPQRAINLVHLLQVLGLKHALHLPLMHSLMALRDNPNSPVRTAEIWDETSTLGRLLRRLGLLYEQGATSDRNLMCDKLYHLVHWAHAQQPHADWLARCTLSGLLRHVVQDLKLAQATLVHGQRWRVPVRITWPDEKYELLFLESALDIWKEGQAMQHCAANYIEACAQGQELMASIRPRAGGKALATLSFELADEQVRMVRISGFANTQASAELLVMANQIALALTELWQIQPVWVPSVNRSPG